MAVLTLAQTYALARGAGLSHDQAVIATAIAAAEHRGQSIRTDALGDLSLQTSTWGPSVGPWQIRSLRAETGTGRSRDITRLTEPTFNARSMYDISRGGRDWSPWSTYNDGLYRGHLSAAAAAAGDQAAAGGPTSPTYPAAVRPTAVFVGDNPFDVDLDLPGVLGPLGGPLEGVLKAAGPLLLGALFVAGGAALVVAGLSRASGGR